jgi:DNA adenine methylase
MTNVFKSPSTLSPFRYPGGKSALRPKVIAWVRDLGYRVKHFVEPFAGGSSVGLAIAELDLADSVVLAELDPDVAAVWNIILNGHARAFAAKIRKFKLNKTSAREILGADIRDRFGRAFRCLLQNRISRGGIMAPGCGVLNYGEAGKGIRSRWYPETLATRIEVIHALRHKIHFVEGDGLKILRRFSSTPQTAAFVDPPYVVRGRGAGLRLYRYHDVDCDELFKAIRNFNGPMIITYHRCDIVEREAKAAGIQCRTVTMHTAHKISKRELILYKSSTNSTALL